MIDTNTWNLFFGGGQGVGWDILRVDRESWFNSTPRDKKSIWSGPLGDRKPPRPITLWPVIELMDLLRPEGRVPDRSPRRQAEENPQPALGRRHSSINGPLLTT